MNTFKHIALLISAIQFWGCHSHDHSHDETHSTEEHAARPKDEVHLLQQQMDVMGIELGHFQEVNLSTTIKTSGQLELPPQNKASVSAMMGGRVTEIYVLEGDFVKKGKTLALLENPEFITLQQEYAQAKNRLAFLEKEYERKKQLFADSISSAKNFQQAESEYLTETAKVNALKARLGLMGADFNELDEGKIISSIPVAAPISGYISDIGVSMGSYVQPEQQMFQIVDNEFIHIDLLIYEKDIPEVSTGQKVIFALATRPDSLFEGKIFAIDKAFNKMPRAVTAHAVIENKQGILLPGMYVDARIVTDDKKTAAVPDDAIVSDAGLNYIFVLKEKTHAKAEHEHEKEEHVHERKEHADENHKESHEGEFIFQKIEVNTGASDIGFTEVVPVQPLPENPTVVVKGAFYLLAEMKKGEGGEGHHH
ncbi:MAG TPA: efflux RND transporter periplasmic adaptor subunit [Chitinophagales bacterium]|nr:efflux RND transporter periplasmic adaptor subunit [Chitinophagales bacterium]